MAATGKKRLKSSRDGMATGKQTDPVDSAHDFHRIEFRRNGFALVPRVSDKDPGVAFLIAGKNRRADVRTCSCTVSRRRTCDHVLELSRLYKAFLQSLGGSTPQEHLEKGHWYGLAGVLAKGNRQTAESVRVDAIHEGSRETLKLVGSDGKELVRMLSHDCRPMRFVERLQHRADGASVPQRGELLDDLAMLTLASSERLLLERGFENNRTAFEKSFWYLFAYHCHREFGSTSPEFEPSIDESTAAFTLTCVLPGKGKVFRISVPPEKVRCVLNFLQDNLLNQHGVSIHPIPLRSIFKVTLNTELDLEVRSVIQVLQEDGEASFLNREDVQRFRYGDLVYVKELGILAELEAPGAMERKFQAPRNMVLKRSQIPSFLEEFGQDLEEGPHIVDSELKSLKILRGIDRIEISPDAIDRDWCWLSVHYGFGNAHVSLAEVLMARRQGQRYVTTPEGWVDCHAAEFDALASMEERFTQDQLADDSRGLPFSRLDLFRLRAVGSKPFAVTGDDERAELIAKVLDLKPVNSIGDPTGLKSPLRDYQKRGLEWLRFLFENSLGGLLCDDMGLGKTHQVMALMVALRDHHNVTEPFLVVSPTTVLSHWSDKLCEHVPGLSVGVYHGHQRSIPDLLKSHDVLLTSYGILRNDIDELMKILFSVAVFDEIQHIKNVNTKAYQAARNIRTHMKLGLTGTPIENRLDDLKALLDLTLPGYMGTDEQFHDKYGRLMESAKDCPEQEELRRLISPFTLRRLKKAVLSELPDKTEEIRTCVLSDDQIKLYRDAISSRGKRLTKILESGNEPVPYIHIFALLNVLKQICNHPALVQDDLENYEEYSAGKWDLFKELLSECLDSGQKAVVFTQYLGMIQIMEDLLDKLGVGFVTFTGASRKRGKLVSRFNEAQDCRVFLGSLKAGGVGIDLVSASVVIHCDRWWNAAREDQATDRVHRIGQKRGVNVFKLATVGTLEEKISAIIDRKRNLMESVIQEDDPGVLKTFSRDALLEMLRLPVATDL